MNATASITEVECPGSPTTSPATATLLKDEEGSKQSQKSARLREHYNLKNVAQMRVAISNVLEATLESAFQLILQLYILGTQYNDLKEVSKILVIPFPRRISIYISASNLEHDPEFDFIIDSCTRLSIETLQTSIVCDDIFGIFNMVIHCLSSFL